MKLFFRRLGQGYPLIILHGLYGSSDNWVSISKNLAEYFEVYILDLRNHGQSPHDFIHNYPALASDILEFFETHSIVKAVVLGHSMGGKVAMYFALKYPERISNLVIVDIAPKRYDRSNMVEAKTQNHHQIIDCLMNLDFSRIFNLVEAEKQIKEKIENEKLKNFLLKNIKRNTDGQYSLRLNIKAIQANFENILKGLDDFSELNNKIGNQYRVLFIRGQQSEYILESDFENIKKRFPYSEIETIPQSGHWVHSEKPDEVIWAIKKFVLKE